MSCPSHASLRLCSRLIYHQDYATQEARLKAAGCCGKL